VSNTYANVDGSTDVAGAVAWQDHVDGWPQIEAYKRRSYELMPDRGLVLDVGSGTGHDIGASGRDMIGVDRSMAMCRTGHTRDRVVVRGDAHSLPFADASFVAARADRVLSHLDDPERAIAEMRRVVAPGGRVVAADPDQGSLVIDIPGVRPALVDAVRELRVTVGYRNGRLARRLPAVLASAGLRDVTVDAFPLVLTDPDEAFGLPTWVSFWREHFTEADEADWAEGNARARAGEPFIYALLYFVVSGVVPGRHG
jgi:SAM-dependent methyltransferase